MNTVKRANIIRRRISRIVFRKPDRKYTTAGDRACRKWTARTPRRRRVPDPEEMAILAWARFELARETVSGFWDRKAASAA